MASTPRRPVPNLRGSLCICSQCSKTSTTDRSGNPVSGVYLTEREIKEHTQSDLARQRVAAAFIPASESEEEAIHTIPPSTQFRRKRERNPDSPTQIAVEEMRMVLAELESLLQQHTPFLKDVVAPSGLVFSVTPTKETPSYGLKSGVSANSLLIDLISRLEAYQSKLDGMALQLPSHMVLNVQVANQRISALQNQIQDEIVRVWEVQLKLSERKNVIDTERYLEGPFAIFAHATIVVWYLLVSTLHLLCGISEADSHFVLTTADILHSLYPPVAMATDSTRAIPQDVRTILDRLHLRPTTISFVCCPRCFYLYDIDSTASYPEKCRNKESPDGPECGRRLRRLHKRSDDSDLWTPTRTFLYHDIKHWLARLYARPDLEPFLDQSNHRPVDAEPDEIWDILDSSNLQNLPGPDDGKGGDHRPFLQMPGNEGRILLSLNEDGLNPFGNKTAGKVTSIGAIYLACLNLPAHLRFRVENMCLVGIIPGPHEPSRHQLNNLLPPLVKDLKLLWKDGIFLSRTSRHSGGRRVRAALVPLVCDLPAALQMAGFSHFSSLHFCHVCEQQLSDIDNLDYKKWTPRDWDTHKAMAIKWRDAATQAERDLIFTTYGVRWSPLLELEYWNAIVMTVIDSMHGFYLRLFQRHCRQIWGMNVDFVDGEGLTFKKIVVTEVLLMDARNILRTGRNADLLQLPTKTLQALCQENNAQYGGRGRRRRLLRDLIQLRIDRKWFDESGKPIRSLPPPPPISSTSEPTPSMASSSRATENSTPSPSTSGNKTKPSPLVSPDLITLDVANHAYQTFHKTALNAMGKKALVMICVMMIDRLVPEDVDKFERARSAYDGFKLSHLQSTLHEQRIAAGILDSKTGKPVKQPQTSGEAVDHLNADVYRPVKRGSTRVLGRQTLAEIRKDMQRCHGPSWLAMGPAHPGESKWGKLSADQWRSFCSIHLVITLIRLWGPYSAESHEHRRLVNFMHLQAAVTLATARYMTPARINLYEFHMEEYLRSLLKLYPGTSITPYQHLSLHFGPTLRGFGPTHGYRCWPFERNNNRLQQIPTNKKFGDMEITMLNRFCMNQNLRSLMQPSTLPAEIHGLLPDFEKTFNAGEQGTLLNDSLALDEETRAVSNLRDWEISQEKVLAGRPAQLLAEWLQKNFGRSPQQASMIRVFMRSEIYIMGQTFQPSLHAHNFGNSKIVFVLDDKRPTEWSAGRIRQIFSVSLDTTSTKTFAVVDIYPAVAGDDAKYDYFRQFPIGGGGLFYTRLRTSESSPVLLPVEKILGHFVYTSQNWPAITQEHFHALPLVKNRHGLY